MKYKQSIEDGVATVKISESLTFSCHQDFRDMLASLADKKISKCIFDISELTAIDSAGLGMFLIAKDAAAENDFCMVIKGPQGQVGSVMKLAKFEDIFEIQ